MERVISRFGFDAIMSVSLIAAEFLCLMGVATNVINIVVFVRLGLRETTNISMLSLAVSDLLQCAIGLWCCLLYIPAFRNAEKSFRIEGMFILTGGMPRLILSRTSALITAYIALERSLCVIFPLRIKTLVTRKRTSVVMVTIYVITICPTILMLNCFKFQWRFFPDMNRTLLSAAYIYSAFNNVVDKVYPLLCGAGYLVVAFVVSSICTAYLMVHLSRASRWRGGHSSASADPGANTTDTDKISAAKASAAKKKEKSDRAVRTVVAITVVFIVCFLPAVVGMVLYAVMPGLTLYGRYGQVFQLIQGTGLLSEGVNTSTNFFIYYTLGSSYRAMFHQVFTP